MSILCVSGGVLASHFTKGLIYPIPLVCAEKKQALKWNLLLII